MPFEAPIHYIRRTSRAKRSLYVEMLKKMCFFKICRFLRQISLTFHIPFNSTFLLKSTHIVIFLIKRLFFFAKTCKIVHNCHKKKHFGLFYLSHPIVVSSACNREPCLEKIPMQQKKPATKLAWQDEVRGHESSRRVRESFRDCFVT